MKNDLQLFKNRLQTDWLPAFCADPKRQFCASGFKDQSIKITEFDAGNFLRAIDSGVVCDSGGGRYRCIQSKATEQIFWEGPRKTQQRSITLWIEPVITIATMARLQLDWGWPAERLGMQSKSWAFDFAIYQGASGLNEHVAGEVKTTKDGIDDMMIHLQEYGRTGATVAMSSHSKHINAFKKWTALRMCRAPLFWAVGPGDYTQLYDVQYGRGNTAVFSKVGLDRLATE